MVEKCLQYLYWKTTMHIGMKWCPMKRLETLTLGCLYVAYFPSDVAEKYSRPAQKLKLLSEAVLWDPLGQEPIKKDVTITTASKQVHLMWFFRGAIKDPNKKKHW